MISVAGRQRRGTSSARDRSEVRLLCKCRVVSNSGRAEREKFFSRETAKLINALDVGVNREKKMVRFVSGIQVGRVSNEATCLMFVLKFHERLVQ